MSVAVNTLRKNLLVRFYKHYVIDSIVIVKQHGFKELIHRRGKKFLFAVIGYYAVRDTLVYIVIPFWLARGVL